MTYLDAPGANIYYESVGEGPMLLCVSGGDGSCEMWRGFADCLKEHFTVVMWDRRGFSRSILTGAQDYDLRLETDVDDAARLIKHFSPQQPATVIGNSSGAIISLKLLIHQPDLVRTVIPHEPPAAHFLSPADFEDHKAQHDKVYDIYRSGGPYPALKEFAKLTKADQTNIVNFIDFKMPYMFSNMMYWFEREFLTYPMTEFDVDRDLRPQKDKLILAYGADSPKDAYQCRANIELGRKLGLDVIEMPGEHVAHATHAKQFSEKLLEALKSKDDYYAKL